MSSTRLHFLSPHSLRSTRQRIPAIHLTPKTFSFYFSRRFPLPPTIYRTTRRKQTGTAHKTSATKYESTSGTPTGPIWSEKRSDTQCVTIWSSLWTQETRSSTGGNTRAFSFKFSFSVLLLIISLKTNMSKYLIKANLLRTFFSCHISFIINKKYWFSFVRRTWFFSIWCKMRSMTCKYIEYIEHIVTK